MITDFRAYAFRLAASFFLRLNSFTCPQIKSNAYLVQSYVFLNLALSSFLFLFLKRENKDLKIHQIFRLQLFWWFRSSFSNGKKKKKSPSTCPTSKTILYFKLFKMLMFPSVSDEIPAT